MKDYVVLYRRDGREYSERVYRANYSFTDRGVLIFRDDRSNLISAYREWIKVEVSK